MLRREGEAMRRREWDAAWSTAAGERGCWLVGVGHELMKLLSGLLFACDGALRRVYDVCKAKFTLSCSNRAKGEGARATCGSFLHNVAVE